MGLTIYIEFDSDYFNGTRLKNNKQTFTQF